MKPLLFILFSQLLLAQCTLRGLTQSNRCYLQTSKETNISKQLNLLDKSLGLCPSALVILIYIVYGDTNRVGSIYRPVII